MINRRDALKLGAATCGTIAIGPSALGGEAPKIGDLCSIEYKFGNNGPWNYCFETPPPGVTHLRYIGYWIGEDERHYLTAQDFAKFEDGRVEPVRLQHWSKDNNTLIIRIISPIPLG